MKRRGFIAAVLGLATAPFVAKVVKALPASSPEPLAFHPDTFSIVSPTANKLTFHPEVTRYDVLYGYANLRPNRLIRWAGEERAYNYCMSQTVEQIALAPKAPWVTSELKPGDIFTIEGHHVVNPQP